MEYAANETTSLAVQRAEVWSPGLRLEERTQPPGAQNYWRGLY